MARVKRAVHARKKHRKVMQRAKGYKGAKSRRFKTANEQVMHAMQDSYDHRRARKGDFRRLWITRINAAARQHDMTYSQLIAGLKAAEITVDRKMLADMAVNDPNSFAQVVERARDAATA
ncbi:MAG: 50S ribosomal protein L20 [Acidimicrobiia bacterium]|nr:50S ribosomal protein L20 [Acidimicrobiia bacterium]